MKASHLLFRCSRSLFQRSALRLSARHTTATTPFLHLSYGTPIQSFGTTRSIHKGLQPDTSNPAPPNTEPHSTAAYNKTPADLTDSEYHEIADQYINNLLFILEQKADDPDSKFEVEYSAGVLELKCPEGVYIINKQPPNKQIWLSSPVSGPKRYDWVTASDGQNVKVGTETLVGDDGQPGGGKWLYLRDGSTMTDLLRSEIDVEVKMEGEEIRAGREGEAGSG